MIAYDILMVVRKSEIHLERHQSFKIKVDVNLDNDGVDVSGQTYMRDPYYYYSCYFPLYIGNRSNL